MALVVVGFGLNGIGCKRSFLRGTDERYPLVTIQFLFFRAIILGRRAASLHLQAMFGLADNSDWLLENYPAMAAKLKEHRVNFLSDAAERANERASKAEAENYALRKVIKICSE
jgi:hypothetical protein